MSLDISGERLVQPTETHPLTADTTETWPRFDVPADERDEWEACATLFDRVAGTFFAINDIEQVSERPRTVRNYPHVAIHYHQDPDGEHVRSFLEADPTNRQRVRVSSLVSRLAVVRGQIDPEEPLWTESHFCHRDNLGLRVISSVDTPQSTAVSGRKIAVLGGVLRKYNYRKQSTAIRTTPTGDYL